VLYVVLNSASTGSFAEAERAKLREHVRWHAAGSPGV